MTVPLQSRSLDPGKARPSRGRWRPLGIWPDVWRSPLDFCIRAAARGGVVHLADFPRTLFLVTSPSAIRHVLVDNAGNYFRGPHWRRAKVILGDGLATADGDAWRHQRAVAQPAFQRDRLARAIPIMHDGIDRVFRAWQAADAPLDATVDLVYLAAHVLLRGLFDVDLRPDSIKLHQAVSVASRHLSRVSLAPWGHSRRWLGLPSYRLRKALAFLDDFVDQIIKRSKACDHAGDDLVSILLRSRDADGKPLTDRRIRDELMTMLTAALETQVSVLTWLLVVLATMPDVCVRLRAEALSSGGQIAELRSARRTVDETLRLYPSGWIFDRVARHDDTLDDVRIGKGSTVLVCPYAVHRHPEWWPDPNRFDPDRFLPERAALRNNYTYLPFGAGPRSCIGAPFAIALATLFASRTAERFECTLAEGRPLVPEAGALLAPPRGTRVLFKAADNSTSHSRADAPMSPASRYS